MHFEISMIKKNDNILYIIDILDYVCNKEKQMTHSFFEFRI